LFTYTRYITEFGERGGELYFLEPVEKFDPNAGGDFDVSEDIIYAISFVSPAEQRCDKDPTQSGAKCFAKIGAYWFIDEGSMAVPGLAIGAIGFKAVKGIVKGIGKLGGFFEKKAVGFVTKVDFTTVKVPNFIIVSSFDDAEKLGCNFD